MDHMFCGKRATIEVKISKLIPLPIPCSVINSPSHMIRPVPAVMVTTIMVMVKMEWSGTTGTVQPRKS